MVLRKYICLFSYRLIVEIYLFDEYLKTLVLDNKNSTYNPQLDIILGSKS